MVEASWNVKAHTQKPDFVFRGNVRVHLNRRGRQFILQLAAEVCASAVVILDTPCSEVVCRVLATHSIRQFPLHFPSRASQCAVTFQLESNMLSCTAAHRWRCSASWSSEIHCSVLGLAVQKRRTGTTRGDFHRIFFPDDMQKTELERCSTLQYIYYGWVRICWIKMQLVVLRKWSSFKGLSSLMHFKQLCLNYSTVSADG